MQEFWIDKVYVPEEFHGTDENCNVKIFIPDNCQHCNSKLEIGYVGNANLAPTNFKSSCDHFLFYNYVWDNRLQNLNDILYHIKQIDPIDDGCNCIKCGLWSSMAAPNQPDNTFKCYPCRSRGW